MRPTHLWLGLAGLLLVGAAEGAAVACPHTCKRGEMNNKLDGCCVPDPSYRPAPAVGTVVVSASHPAEVLLDGKPRGHVLPMTLAGVPAGAHVLELVDKAFEPWRSKVTVAPGKKVYVDAVLVPRSECPKGMVVIPGGTLVRDRAGTTAQVARYCLDVTEVTVAAYQACVAAGGCTADGLACDAAANYGVTGRDQHPVNCVAWSQASGYCGWRGARLASEDEWQWAASGGGKGKYPWGDAAPDAQLCWSGSAARAGTCPVASYPAGVNAWGVADLAGNVWEWVADHFDQRTYVRRGGGWQTASRSFLSALFRGSAGDTSGRSGDLGFRCARTP